MESDTNFRISDCKVGREGSNKLEARKNPQKSVMKICQYREILTFRLKNRDGAVLATYRAYAPLTKRATQN